MGSCFRARSKRCMTVCAAVLLICLVSGCYEHVTDGQKSLYQFAWWVGPLVIAGGILGIPIGWWIRKWNAKWGFVMMGMAPLLLVIVAPGMYTDRVLIDDEHFETRYGFWFDPSVHDIRFDNLREIRFVAVPGSRGRTNHEMRCTTKKGETTVVHAGDLVMPTVPEILARAEKRGVKVVVQE